MESSVIVKGWDGCVYIIAWSRGRRFGPIQDFKDLRFSSTTTHDTMALKVAVKNKYLSYRKPKKVQSDVYR